MTTQETEPMQDATKVVTVTERLVYGNPLLYPVCPMAKLVAEIAYTKTLSPTAVRVLKKHGYTVRVIPAAEKTI